VSKVVHSIDDFDLAQFVRVAADFGSSRFGYVVTPNVDHLVRYHEDASFRAIYRHATYVLLDSRFCARLLLLLKGVRLPVCTGSDLTAELLSTVARPSDRIVILGASAEMAKSIAAGCGLQNLRHYNPPMNFINHPQMVEQCLSFIEAASPFRFCFLAVGSPQQEVLARDLQARGAARGLALCVGASLNFITGAETRAPSWMQRLCLEWLFRLISNPRRLAYRYLVRGPRIFAYLPRARFVRRLAAREAS
jgi:exopolysaccharide biosynthesis WecB/TagA/CpsF family protein